MGLNFVANANFRNLYLARFHSGGREGKRGLGSGVGLGPGVEPVTSRAPPRMDSCESATPSVALTLRFRNVCATLGVADSQESLRGGAREVAGSQTSIKWNESIKSNTISLTHSSYPVPGRLLSHSFKQ